MTLDDLRLNPRARNCLLAARVETVEQLLAHSPRQLLQIRRFGESTLAHVVAALAAHGLYLATAEPIGQPA